MGPYSNLKRGRRNLALPGSEGGIRNSVFDRHVGVGFMANVLLPKVEEEEAGWNRNNVVLCVPAPSR
jgi:hypothetical protein